VRQGFHAVVIGHLSQQMPQHWVARRFKRHVADEVRQLVAGVDALEVRPAIDVVAGIDQPVCVKHHQRVHAHGPAAAADFVVAVDGALA
jgi:hypothetical protein